MLRCYETELWMQGNVDVLEVASTLSILLVYTFI